MTLPVGKLPNSLLESLLKTLPEASSEVKVGPSIGEDAAVIDHGGPELLVVKTDPITFATEDIGRYLLAVNGNDLATMGAEPRWLLVTSLLPEGVTGERVERIFDEIREACAETGIALVGGHTEITHDLDRPILVGCLLGTVARDRLIRTSGARPGDAVLLTGGLAIEGTAILAREHADVLREYGVEDAPIQRAARWLRNPGISVLPAARVLRGLDAVHSMHDPTEGGLITALHEVAEAAEVGLWIDGDTIPVLPDCATICQALALDPLGLLASGALLASVDTAAAPRAVELLDTAGIPAAVIGEVLPPDAGRTLVQNEEPTPLPIFERDELARFLG